MEKNVYNLGGEYIGREVTCPMCGEKWFVGTRNMQGIAACSKEFRVVEWDGSVEIVHLMCEFPNELLVIRYQDGLEHEVTKEYFYGPRAVGLAASPVRRYY
jgi:hypothetical protein